MIKKNGSIIYGNIIHSGAISATKYFKKMKRCEMLFFSSVFFRLIT